jgi:curved DNA-binding protein CbpA
MQIKGENSYSPIRESLEEVDYYDVLQIGPKADTETIHRVFRIMAARFHPDNVETGDLGRFLSLKEAYETLSNPERRDAYDELCRDRNLGPMPIFELKDFVTGVEAETNRRLGILSLLYNQRRRDPEHPGVSLLDLEQRMAFPREYLTFAVWYLRAKDFVTVADNSDFALTAAGADYVESNASQNQVLNHLLQSGGARSAMHFSGSPDARNGLCGQTLRLESGREQAAN